MPLTQINIGLYPSVHLAVHFRTFTSRFATESRWLNHKTILVSSDPSNRPFKTGSGRVGSRAPNLRGGFERERGGEREGWRGGGLSSLPAKGQTATKHMYWQTGFYAIRLITTADCIHTVFPCDIYA